MEEEYTKFSSRYDIGELVDFIIPKDKITDNESVENYKIPAYVRGIFFVTGKVRYDLFLATVNTTLHLVDSAFVQDSTSSGFNETIEFEPITFC